MWLDCVARWANPGVDDMNMWSEVGLTSVCGSEGNDVT